MGKSSQVITWNRYDILFLTPSKQGMGGGGSYRWKRELAAPRGPRVDKTRREVGEVKVVVDGEDQTRSCL